MAPRQPASAALLFHNSGTTGVAVSPGVVDTAWWSFLNEHQRTAQFEAAAQSIAAGRVGTAEDIASAIGYLISASYVSGKVLPVDGGASAA